MTNRLPAPAWRAAVRIVVACALLLIAQAVLAGAREIRTIVLTVGDLDRAAAFYEGALGFERIATRTIDDPEYRNLLDTPAGALRNAVLRLGAETIQLEEHGPSERGAARPVPADSRSNDLWFQHFAIVVSDMDQAVARLRGFEFAPISDAPQTIPASNVAAAGIRAYKFRDPDGHPLELIYFPPGKGAPRWQAATGSVFLGIDHSAITISDTARSLAFYRDALGFTVVGSNTNTGATQAALDAIADPVVRITGLRARLDVGPGLEFLQYVAPGTGRPSSGVRTDDLVHARLVIEVDDVDALLRDPALARRTLSPPVMLRSSAGAEQPRRAALVADPDGHALLLMSR